MPRQTCIEDHDGIPCGRPKSKRSNKWCSWDWLLNQPPSVRDQNSVRRRDLFKQDPASTRPDDRECRECKWMVPSFYMGRGRRCIGCEGKAAHESKILNTYDLQAGDWDALFALQNGRCAICRKRQVKKRLATDHDHPSDVVRGLLCQWCNEQVLGSLGGDTEKALPVARALVYYLETHPSSGRWEPPEHQPEFGFPQVERVVKPLVESVLGPPDPNPNEMRLAPF